ncbi:hypothetical protein S83_063700 [Arachis hypogaea]
MHGSPVPAHQDGEVVPEPGPVVDDYIPEFPPVDLDMSMELLSIYFSDLFTIEPIGSFAVAPGQASAVEHISPSGTASTGDNSDGSPHSTLEVIVISDDEDIEEIKIVDLTSVDDEFPEIDIEIVDLTSDSD